MTLKVESIMQKNIRDPYLGIIEYSEDLDRYEGKVYTENNKPIKFNFDVDDDLERMVKIARNIVKTIASKYSEYEQYITEQLLDLYNDDWIEEEIIDKQEFVQRITLESATIYDDNSAEIYYRDGDLFAGHYIVINLNSKGILDEPYLAG